MSVTDTLRTWWQTQTGEEDTPFDGDSAAFFASLIFHLCLLIFLGLFPWVIQSGQVSLTVAPPTDETLEELELPEDVFFGDQPMMDIGANAVQGLEMAMSVAPILSDVSAVPSSVEQNPTLDGQIELNQQIEFATGLNFNHNLAVKGAAGEGVTGASGAVDRLTFEILRSLEERKTLVVWMFDQSNSLTRQREEINNRFDRIYEELGVVEAAGNPAFAKHDSKPLLTSVMAFGQQTHLLTPQPTDDLATIKAAVDNIEIDESGDEMIFSTINVAVDRYKHFKTRSPATNQPERNVMLIVFTDERGDDHKLLDGTIRTCQGFQIPVYVVGVPAPFGQEETKMKWVDPDPQYDQSPQWGLVNQGPETLMPERIKVNFCSYDDVGAIDSGFGPFALTRLCYETGGIYFAVHPNRNVYHEISEYEVSPFSSYLRYFFDPAVMRRYQPDYVPLEQYMRELEANKARSALVTASTRAWTAESVSPQVKFVRRSDADLINAVNKAMSGPAQLEPLLTDVYNILKQGEAARQRETVPRWQAGYDLAMGRTLSLLVRLQAYKVMLQQLKQGKAFEDGQNNTWRLIPTDDLTIDANLGPVAEEARAYLQRVIDDHPDTPWSFLAQRELDAPFGWSWNEEFTDLTPRVRRGIGGGGGGGGGGIGRGVGGGNANRPPKRPPPRL